MKTLFVDFDAKNNIFLVSQDITDLSKHFKSILIGSLQLLSNGK